MILVSFVKNGENYVNRYDSYQDMVDFFEENYHLVDEFKVKIFD